MRADTWILHELPEELVADWYNQLIFNEYDMQVATYYWLRREFERSRSETWTVRTQPTIKLRGGRTVKPDVILFRNTVPYDVLELKCQLEGLREDELDSDLDKLHQLKTEWNIRHAYQVVLYDHDDVLHLTYDKEPWMLRYLTFVGANVRRHELGRLRRDYGEARRRWQRCQ